MLKINMKTFCGCIYWIVSMTERASYFRTDVLFRALCWPPLFRRRNDTFLGKCVLVFQKIAKVWYTIFGRVKTRITGRNSNSCFSDEFFIKGMVSLKSYSMVYRFCMLTACFHFTWFGHISKLTNRYNHKMFSYLSLTFES